MKTLDEDIRDILEAKITQYDACADVIERLQAENRRLHAERVVLHEQVKSLDSDLIEAEARVAELEQGLRVIAFDLFPEDAPPLAEKLLGETLEEYLAQYRETEE